MTDSMRMFELGIAGGRPKAGEIGAAPEWFYKGHGEILQPPSEPLTVPAHAEDGGEEAEIAGIYLIAKMAHPTALACAQATNSPIIGSRVELSQSRRLQTSPMQHRSRIVVGGDFRRSPARSVSNAPDDRLEEAH